MKYEFKRIEEMAWVIAVAAGTVLVEVLVTFDAAKVDDWKVWAIGVGSGMVRAAAGAALAFLSRPK